MGVIYEELEPFYEKFARLAGTSGRAGNLRGQIQPDGNPFEGPRGHDYPLPPLERTRAAVLFDQAARKMGYHPFLVPAGNTSGAYVLAFVAALLIGGSAWFDAHQASEAVLKETCMRSRRPSLPRQLRVGHTLIAHATALRAIRRRAGRLSLAACPCRLHLVRCYRAITPDHATGIGNWTDADFVRAVKHGIGKHGKHGKHLYPAMPYTAYAQVDDQDIHDIKAYLDTLKPVRYAVDSNQLPFPFKFGLLMFDWNLLFFDDGPFRPDPTHSVEWNRGAYLVQGLGHCASCHTAKNVLGGDEAFLPGGRCRTGMRPRSHPIADGARTVDR